MAKNISAKSKRLERRLKKLGIVVKVLSKEEVESTRRKAYSYLA